MLVVQVGVDEGLFLLPGLLVRMVPFDFPVPDVVLRVDQVLDIPLHRGPVHFHPVIAQQFFHDLLLCHGMVGVRILPQDVQDIQDDDLLAAFLVHVIRSSNQKLVNIFQSLTGKCPIRLSWTHYSIILQEKTADGRVWYEQEAATEMWDTRTLQRNVSSQYYHRLLKSQDKDAVRNEMKALTAPLQDKLEYLKNPVIAEFLGFKNNTDYSESKLEQSIIDHLIPFLMELGKGFAFVDRQKHIHTEKEDYYIDLVFYNYHLRCFVLIDLKTTKLRYQDVGQMDMYVKMYDELVRPDGHNPTIGILLCADTDEDVAHYSVLNNNDQLFASKYLTYMPTQEELRREIEQQKEFFRLQNKK